MRSAETLRSIATKFRKLAEDANEEFAAHLLSLAEEYERMAGQFQAENPPSVP